MARFIRSFVYARVPARVSVGVLLACVWCAWTGDATAQTYIVDNQHPGASSSGPGTESQPYSTILAAVTVRKGPGITILVSPGSYPEQISVPASGSAAAPYVIRANGPGVVLEGADDLSGED